MERGGGKSVLERQKRKNRGAASALAYYDLTERDIRRIELKTTNERGRRKWDKRLR